MADQSWRRKNFEKDHSFNRYDNYEHVYCRTCHHSLWFKANHPAICQYCGTLVYPSKKCEFKQKLERELKKSKYREEL